MRLLPSLWHGSPDAEDESRGLEALQALIDDLSEWGGSYPYADKLLESSYEMDREESLRLYINAASGMTVTLPRNPYDGARLAIVDTLGSLAMTPLTVDPNGLKFDGASDPALVTAASVWLFRSDLGGWIELSALGLEDDLPFPAEFDRAFAAMLAMELSAEAPNSPPPTAKVAQMAEDGRMRISTRYVEPRAPRMELSVLCMPSRLKNRGLEWSEPVD